MTTSVATSITRFVAIATIILLSISTIQAAPLGQEVAFHGLKEDEWRDVEQIRAEIDAISKRIQSIIQPRENAIIKENLEEDKEDDKNEELEVEDIFLTKEQALFLLDELKEEERRLLKSSGRVKRRAIVPVSKRWDLPIRYMFDSSHESDSDKQKIREAFQVISDETCITFNEIPRQSRYNWPFLNITNVNRMCASFVGRADTAQGLGQDITLSSTCLTNKGTPVHEICHALGLWHEHQRSDRSQNIKILYENIPFWARINFEPAPSDNHHTDDVYDFNSVLQYGPQTSSINRKNTIEPLDTMFYQNMGQRVGLSFLDAKILNNMYCSGECRHSYLNCQHGGYPDPKDCSRCRCPDGLGDRNCEQVATSKLDDRQTSMCGGTIDVGGYRWIQTPYYGYGNYPLNLECNWKFRATPGQVIQLQFYDRFGISSYKGKNIMCTHWIEVKKDTNNFGLPGYRFCGEDTPRAVITSTGEEMVVTFRSLDPTSNNDDRRGVRMLVQSVYPGGYGGNPTQTPQPQTDPPRTSPPRFTTRPTTRTTTKRVTTIPTTLPRPTTTMSTPRVTTEKRTPPTTTEMNRNRFGYTYSWTSWSSCQGDIYCSCGGCSFQTRYRLCNGGECPKEHAYKETKPCDRLCESTDTRYVYIGTLLKTTCSQCCTGFTLNYEGNRCVPDKIYNFYSK